MYRWIRYFLFVILMNCVTSAAALTVLSLNLANYNDHPDWSTRLNLVVAAIKQAKADVVVLQEVRFDPDEKSSQLYYQNMGEEILRKLNEQNEFLNASIVTQPIMFYPQEHAKSYPQPANVSTDKKSHIWEGLSIISKVKILETGSYFLSKSDRCSDFNKRATQYVKLENQGKLLYIANVHFGLTSICIADNINETLTYLKHITQGLPLVVMGDFNTTPDNPDLAKFASASLADVWTKLHPDMKGYTFPANKPDKRIDYMWSNFDIQQIALIGDHFQGDVYPSDHLGLVASF